VKAREAAAHTGLLAVADDSGLAVDALNGMPGLLSARWAGATGTPQEVDRANLELVLAQLRDIPDGHRGAAFHCAAALAHPDGRFEVVHGLVRGTLVREPRGSHGFGYDPLFVPLGHCRTTAELTAGEKDELSHRGRALRALLPHLTRLA
jgi:XTP/dITP diphosphohydrolase